MFHNDVSFVLLVYTSVMLPGFLVYLDCFVNTAVLTDLSHDHSVHFYVLCTGSTTGLYCNTVHT